MTTCKHETSLHGRCESCGMTWEEQARVRALKQLAEDLDQEVYRQVVEHTGIDPLKEDK